MNTNVDLYFTDGCGRCKFGGTPQCKVNKWPQELKLLRAIVLDCGLTEESKWGMPCYTYQKKNILIVSAFKEYCSINFFKGVLLRDEAGILSKVGENTNVSRQLRFTNVKEKVEEESLIKAYIFEAIEIEKAGIKVPKQETTEMEYPEELIQKMNEIPLLKTAFEALTPGRKRGYIFHFTQAKQVKTRESRIEKCIPQILEGKGMNE